MRPLLNFIVGAIVSASLLVAYHRWQRTQNPCLDLCGPGTICESQRCTVMSAQPQTPATPLKRKRVRPRGTKAQQTEQDTVVLQTPSPADLKPQSFGAAVTGTDYIDAAEQDDSHLPELTLEEVDPNVRRLNPKLVDCIDQARENWAIDRGKVQLSFRVERSGRIEKIHVVAPALLMQHGLYACMAQLIKGLSFPQSRNALVVTYPYELN